MRSLPVGLKIEQKVRQVGALVASFTSYSALNLEPAAPVTTDWPNSSTDQPVELDLCGVLF